MQFNVDIQQSHLLKPNENCMPIKMSVSEPELGIFTKSSEKLPLKKKVKVIEVITPLRPWHHPQPPILLQLFKTKQFFI